MNLHFYFCQLSLCERPRCITVAHSCEVGAPVLEAKRHFFFYRQCDLQSEHFNSLAWHEIIPVESSTQKINNGVWQKSQKVHAWVHLKLFWGQVNYDSQGVFWQKKKTHLIIELNGELKHFKFAFLISSVAEACGYWILRALPPRQTDKQNMISQKGSCNN